MTYQTPKIHSGKENAATRMTAAAGTSQRMNAVLYDAASFTRRIEEKHLRAAQLPNSIPGIGVHKPPHW